MARESYPVTDVKYLPIHQLRPVFRETISGWEDRSQFDLHPIWIPLPAPAPLPGGFPMFDRNLALQAGSLGRIGHEDRARFAL